MAKSRKTPAPRKAPLMAPPEPAALDAVEPANVAFARFAALKKKDRKPFAALTISRGRVHVGDGGTFVCQVRQTMKKGTLRLYWLPPAGEVWTSPLVLALVDGSEPDRWEDAGAFVIDSGIAAVIPDDAKKAIDGLDDETEALTDAIDEAIFGGEEDTAILDAPGGKKFSVFKLGGDGTYGVDRGLDEDDAVVALLLRV
jgi:hypothetical protein